MVSVYAHMRPVPPDANHIRLCGPTAIVHPGFARTDKIAMYCWVGCALHKSGRWQVSGSWSSVLVALSKLSSLVGAKTA